MSLHWSAFGPYSWCERFVVEGSEGTTISAEVAKLHCGHIRPCRLEHSSGVLAQSYLIIIVPHL